MLLVVMSPEVYKSKHVLREIHSGVEKSMAVLPILFETPIPSLKDVWPTPRQGDDGIHELMVETVRKGFYEVNCYPAPRSGMEISRNPHLLEEAVIMILERLATLRRLTK